MANKINETILDSHLERWAEFGTSVFVDVDGTLIDPEFKPDKTIVDVLVSLKKKYGDKLDIVVYSTGGKKHAQKAVDACNINDIVSFVTSKPIVVIDDMLEFGCFCTTYIAPNGDESTIKENGNVRPEDVF